MIKPLLCALVLGTSVPSILKPAQTEDGGTWEMKCGANAENCGVGKYILSNDNPTGVWVKVAFFPRDEELMMIILTAPLALPRAHLTLDQKIETVIDADTCEADKCVFTQMIDADTRKSLMSSDTLEVEVSIKADETVKIPVDMKGLDGALKKIPVEL